MVPTTGASDGVFLTAFWLARPGRGSAVVRSSGVTSLSATRRAETLARLDEGRRVRSIVPIAAADRNIYVGQRTFGRTRLESGGRAICHLEP